MHDVDMLDCTFDLSKKKYSLSVFNVYWLVYVSFLIIFYSVVLFV